MKYFLLLALGFTIIGPNVQSQKYVALAKPAGGKDFGFINEKGDFILPPIYKYPYGFSEYGLAPIYDSFKDEMYYINLKGDTILKSNDNYNLIKPEGGELHLHKISERSLVVELKGKKGIINTEGDIIVDTKYDKLFPFMEQRAIGCIDEQYYIIGLDGETDSVEYLHIDETEGFSCGRAKFKSREGKYGFFSKTGKVVIEPSFLSSHHFTNNIAGVQDKEGFWGLIDTTGAWVVEPSYRTIWPFKEGEEWTIALDNFRNDVILSTDGTFRYLNKFKSIGFVSNNLLGAQVQFDSKGKDKKKKEERRHNYGYINMEGTWAIYPSYNWIREFQNGYATVHVGGLWGLIDTYGVWAVKPTFVHMGNMVKVDVTEAELLEENVQSQSIEVVDIIHFLSIIDQLNISTGQEKLNKNWDAFFNQDHKFADWLLDFKSDTLKYGLYSKAKGLFISQNTDHSYIKICDSQVALILLGIFLSEDCNFEIRNISYTYDQVEALLEENKQKEISELRELWQSKL